MNIIKITDGIREAKSHVEKLAKNGLISEKEIMDFNSGITLTEQKIAEQLPEHDQQNFFIVCGN